jgi:hypothetical protein
VQVVIVVGLVGTVMPRTAYAIYAWSVIIHTFIQIPGFYQLYRHALTGLQRFDYAQLLDLGLAVVFPMLTQPVFVTAMLVWGRTHPAFGISMSGLIGLGLAAYAAEALTFLVGIWLNRRLGYNAGVYFLAHFDWQVIKKAFRFGTFEMLGSAMWGIGQSLEILITQTFLVNYGEVWGNWVLAQNFVFSYQVIATLFNNEMPSISEAISHGRKVLSKYYSAIARRGRFQTHPWVDERHAVSHVAGGGGPLYPGSQRAGVRAGCRLRRAFADLGRGAVPWSYRTRLLGG